MSQTLLAQQAYASRAAIPGAVTRPAPIARDKSRDRTHAASAAIGLSRPNDVPFSQILAQIAAKTAGR